TMIFGLFPMMIATGVGANGNRSLGTSTIGGMFIGTLALLFIVPSLFIVFQTLQEKIKPLHFSKVKDQQIEHEKQRYADEQMKRSTNEEGSNNDVSNQE
ncbi:MAG: efflux RND transporter permease subunit, partial [Tannerellaceae bacterium]